ncbi:MAG: hypothetical protein AB8E15_02400 [Bdellovibrionales bacterium]
MSIRIVWTVVLLIASIPSFGSDEIRTPRLFTEVLASMIVEESFQPNEKFYVYQTNAATDQIVKNLSPREDLLFYYTGPKNNWPVTKRYVANLVYLEKGRFCFSWTSEQSELSREKFIASRTEDLTCFVSAKVHSELTELKLSAEFNNEPVYSIFRMSDLEYIDRVLYDYAKLLELKPILNQFRESDDELKSRVEMQHYRWITADQRRNSIASRSRGLLLGSAQVGKYACFVPNSEPCEILIPRKRSLRDDYFNLVDQEILSGRAGSP